MSDPEFDRRDDEATQTHRPLVAPSAQDQPTATKAESVPAGPPTAATLPTVPGYDILKVLGRGGMGVVYLARQRAADRLVALKMILGGAHASDVERLRFRTEIQAIARLQHPGIVQLYDVSEYEGLPFFTLEHCAGGNLSGGLAGQPWEPGRAADLIVALAEAVHFANAAGIVHRDLKPANVLLTADGRPKVADFGLAKLQDLTAVTASGAVLGTPSYMAPEQAGGKGKQIGPATDVYALGAILYELLTGRKPFHGDTPLETMMKVVNEPPVPPRQVHSNVPQDLETICLKAMAKEPANRYTTAAELADDLRRWRHGGRVAAQAPSQPRPAQSDSLLSEWATLVQKTVRVMLLMLASSGGLRQQGAMKWILHLLLVSLILAGLWYLNSKINIARFVNASPIIVPEFFLPIIFGFIYALFWFSWIAWKLLRQKGSEQESPYDYLERRLGKGWVEIIMIAILVSTPVLTFFLVRYLG